MDNTTLLVSSCDAYWPCWDPFCHGLNKYWVNHFPVRFVTNFKPAPLGETILVGADRGWSDNLVFALEQVTTPYIIYAQEDYWINRPVDSSELQKYASFLAREEADYIRLYPSPPPDRPFAHDPRLGIINADAQYRASLQMSFWRKSVLRALLVTGETAWQFEVQGSQRSRRYGDRFLSVNAKRNGVSYVFTAVERGEWTRRARKYAKVEALSVNWKGLPRKPFFRYLKHHCIEFLYERKEHLKKRYQALVARQRRPKGQLQ